jgi:nuclear protein localization protein 4 homolog
MADFKNAKKRKILEEKKKKLRFSSGFASMASGAGRSGGQTNGGLASHDMPMSNPGEWTCKHCTFVNSGPVDACEMCGLPH